MLSNLPDTHLLVTFLEVSRLGTVTAAAESLRITQPAVSQRLKQLQEWMGVRLFERVGRRLELTEYGVRLQHDATGALARLQSVRQSVLGEGEEPSGTVRLGTLPTLARHGFLSCIAGVVRDYPQLKLTFRFGVVAEMLKLLRVGELDALVLIGDVDQSWSSSEQIGEIRIVAAMSPAWSEENMSLSALRKRRYLAWSGPTDPTFGFVADFAASSRLVGPSTPEIPHIETLRALAAAGVGYTLLPDYTTWVDERMGLIRTQPVPGLNRSFGVYLVGRTEQVFGPAASLVRSMITDSWRSHERSASV